MRGLTLLLILGGVGALIAWGMSAGAREPGALEIMPFSYGGRAYEIRLESGQPLPIPGGGMSTRYKWQVFEQGSEEILQEGHAMNRDAAVEEAQAWITGASEG